MISTLRQMYFPYCPFYLKIHKIITMFIIFPIKMLIELQKQKYLKRWLLYSTQITGRLTWLPSDPILENSMLQIRTDFPEVKIVSSSQVRYQEIQLELTTAMTNSAAQLKSDYIERTSDLDSWDSVLEKMSSPRSDHRELRNSKVRVVVVGVRANTVPAFALEIIVFHQTGDLATVPGSPSLPSWSMGTFSAP